MAMKVIIGVTLGMTIRVAMGDSGGNTENDSG